MKKTFFLLLLLITLIGCNGHYILDNPTDENIKVYIDSTEYNLKPKEFIKVKLKTGNHTVSAEKNGTKILDNETFKIGDIPAGLINPTKNDYVIYYIIYTKDSNLQNDFKPYEIDGKEIYSLLDSPEVTNGLFIEDRTLGKGNIDKNPPKTMKINGKYSFFMKIFRKDDFFKFYDEHM